MKITRKSQLTGVIRTREIDVTEEQLQQWKAGRSIQWLLPHLSAEDREFLLTGATSEEWDEAFPDIEE